MTSPAVSFETIKVSRMLGIARGDGFTLEDLSSGVNLILGPNGSGKTTTALALQEALWPGNTGLDRPSFSAVLSEGTQRWTVESDAGHVTWLRGGLPADAPLTVSPVLRSRYRLSLHELLAAEDRDFAEHVVRESQGGFDLNRAVETLGFRVSDAIGRAENKLYMDRHDAVSQALASQEDLLRASQELVDLEHRFQEAVQAGQALETLKTAIEHTDAAVICDALSRDVSAFPSVLSCLTGHERDVLNDLDDRIVQLEERIHAAHRQIAASELVIAEAAFPSGVDARSILPVLRATLQSIRRREHRRETVQRDRDQAATREAAACRRLGDVASPEQRERLQTVHVEAVGNLAKRVHRLRAAEAVLAERRRQLNAGSVAASNEPDIELVRKGMLLLSAWLSAPGDARAEAGGAGRWIGWAASVLLAAVGLVLSVSVHLAGIVVMAAGVFLTILWYRDGRRDDRRRSVETPDVRAIHQHQYAATGLPAPEEWTARTVIMRLEALCKTLSGLSMDADRRIRLRELASEEDALAADKALVAQERLDIESRLGLAPALDEEWLPLLVENLGQWQRSVDDVAVATRELQSVQVELDGLYNELIEGLSRFGVQASTALEANEKHIELLESRRERCDQARQKILEEESRIRENDQPDLDRLRGERVAVLKKVDLSPENEAQLDILLSQLTEYRRLRDALSVQKTLRDDLARRLSGFPELLEKDRPDLEKQRARAETVAGERDTLSQRIAAIQRDLDHARRGSDLTDALAARDAAQSALEDARDRRMLAAVGAVLSDWLRMTVVDSARPRVFRRAQELLAGFTRGLLTLDVDDQSPEPRFRARTSTGVIRNVDALSAGERVQLLIAVRLAFLEQEEHQRLPLLLDEVLGVSDDDRAGAMIETVIAIAASGRQVFYFTAQHDEAGKWRASLASSGLPFKLFDLARIRQRRGPPMTPLAVDSPPRAAIPAPGDLSYAAYGERLGVPAFDPGCDHLANLHLWYLLDDPALLYEVLKLGICAWGQLRLLLAHDGAGLVARGETAFRRAEAVARVFDAALDAWRTGRGKSVDRAILEDSGYVSERFIDRVSAVCADVNGDARQLLAHLEVGEVKGWRQSNTIGLAEVFRDHGYLDERPCLDPGDLRVRVMATAKDDIRGELITPDRIDQVVGLFQDPPVTA